MALNINFQDDEFNVDFADASDKFQVTFENTDSFNVEFVDESGDTFSVELIDASQFDVSFEQDSFSVVLEDSDTFNVDFQDNTFEVVFEQNDTFEVVFDIGVSSPNAGSVVIPNPPGASGEELNRISIDGTDFNIPTGGGSGGTNVQPNPGGTNGEDITRIQIAGTDFNIPVITTAQSDEITANSLKVGITTAQSDAIVLNTDKVTNITTWSDYANGGLFNSTIDEPNGSLTVKLQFGGSGNFVFRNVVENPIYTDTIYSEEALTTVLATRGG